MTKKIKDFFEEYKKFILEEYASEDASFDCDGYLNLAHTSIGANEEFGIQVSYNPTTEKIKTEIYNENLYVRTEETCPLKDAYWYLNFDECYSKGNDLVEKLVDEDFEW